MIADMIRSKDIGKVVTKLFILEKDRYISFVFITQFPVSKKVSLNSRDYFIVKISKKGERQQIVNIYLTLTMVILWMF